MYNVYYAKDYRAMARNSLRGNWGKSILVYFVAYLLGAAGSISEATSNSSYVTNNSYVNTYPSVLDYNIFTIITVILAPFVILALLYGIFTFVFGASIELGLNNYFINLQQNPQQAKISNLFERMDIFLQALWLRIVMGFFIAAWSLLLVVPGIVAAYRYSMAPYIMAQNPGIGALEAINISKQMMDGNKGKLFCLDWSFFGWILLGTLTFGIGMLFVYPYMEAARASFYLNLNANYQMTQNMNGMPPYGGGPVQGQPYAPQQPYQTSGPVQGQPYTPQQPVQGQPSVQQPTAEPTPAKIPNSVYNKPEQVTDEEVVIVAEEKETKEQEQDTNS